MFVEINDCNFIILDIFTGINWPLSCWAQIYPAFSNNVDPDQLAALFAIKYVNL